jgi:bacteriorhodopsin
MPELSIGQYSLVFNMLSFAVAAMFGSFAFFVMSQKLIGPKYRASMIVSSLVVLIAGYHYFRIMGSWEAAYQLVDGSYVASGKPFNDAYRYVDWLLTVPLLLVELILVLNLGKGQTGPMLTKLIIAALLMIGLGYPGEISTDSTTRHIWGTLSSIPFFYILYVLWGQLGSAIGDAPAKIKNLFEQTRWVLLITWAFYPIAYLIGTFGGAESGGAEVGLQVAYSIADVTAKAFYGCMIFAIAYEKSAHDGSLPSMQKA